MYDYGLAVSKIWPSCWVNWIRSTS